MQNCIFSWRRQSRFTFLFSSFEISTDFSQKKSFDFFLRFVEENLFLPSPEKNESLSTSHPIPITLAWYYLQISLSLSLHQSLSPSNFPWRNACKHTLSLWTHRTHTHNTHKLSSLYLSYTHTNTLTLRIMWSRLWNPFLSIQKSLAFYFLEKTNLKGFFVLLPSSRSNLVCWLCCHMLFYFSVLHSLNNYISILGSITNEITLKIQPQYNPAHAYRKLQITIRF